MGGESAGLSEPARRVLIEAHTQLRAAEPGDFLRRYDVCRVALSTISRVDILLVALIDEATQTTAFPYYWVQDRLVDGGVFPYGPRGMTSWILASRRTYRWSDDGGALFRRGWPGEGESATRDVLAVPFARADGHVRGFIVMCSDESDVYDGDVIVAAEWLVNLLGDIQQNQYELLRSQVTQELYPELGSDVLADEVNLLSHLSEQLLAIRDAAADPEGGAEAVARLCDGLRANILTRLYTRDRPPNRLDELSTRERDVAQAILGSDDPSTAALAAALHVSEATVKSHIASIMRKLGVKHRSDIARVVQERPSSLWS